MLRNRLAALTLALGMAIPAVSFADWADKSSAPEVKGQGTYTSSPRSRNFVFNRRPSAKNGRFTPVGESGKWRQGYGAYGGRGRREASNLQKNKVDPSVGVSVGATKEVGVLNRENKLDDKALAGCGGGYKVLTAGASAAAGIQKGDGKSKLSNLSCNVGVEGTLAAANIDCVKVLGGDRDNGVLVRGGASAGAGANLGCQCNGPGVVCEAFIGVKGSIDGGIGGTLCGVGVVVNAGLEGGAGAGGKVQAGYVKGKGFGLAVAGYIGLGGGAKVFIDPKLDGILEGKTWKCLGDKALGAIKGVGGAISNGVKGALNRLGGLFGGNSGGGSGGSTVHRTLTK